MIEKSDWVRAHRDVMERRRARLGPPPSPEELQAYAEGRMSPSEHARMQELLTCYPEVARALAGSPAPAPEEAVVALTAEELAHDWAAIEARLEVSRMVPSPAAPRAASSPGAGRPATRRRTAAREGGPRSFGWAVQLWYYAGVGTALAAAVLGGLLYDAHHTIERQARELGQPRVVDRHLLLPDGWRGGGAVQPPIEVVPAGDVLLLAPQLPETRLFPDYRLDLADLGGAAPHPVWSRTGLARRGDDTFEVLVPRRFLAGRDYRLTVAGLGLGKPQILATYTLRLPRR